jgi:hypothetical protein
VVGRAHGLQPHSIEERARKYLFEEHSEQELRAWARRLRRFRFCRAFGGHAGDGDTLRLHLRIHSVEDALGIVASLDAERRENPVNPGMRRSEVAPGIEQPGWSTIGDTTLFIWINPASVEFSVQDVDDVWAVTEAAVQAAERIEPRFVPFGSRVIDPPVDSWHCIAPATHPELFE